MLHGWERPAWVWIRPTALWRMSPSLSFCQSCLHCICPIKPKNIWKRQLEMFTYAVTYPSWCIYSSISLQANSKLQALLLKMRFFDTCFWTCSVRLQRSSNCRVCSDVWYCRALRCRQIARFFFLFLFLAQWQFLIRYELKWPHLWRQVCSLYPTDRVMLLFPQT